FESLWRPAVTAVRTPESPSRTIPIGVTIACRFIALPAAQSRCALHVGFMRKYGAGSGMSHVRSPINLSPLPTTFAVKSQLLKSQLMYFPEMTPFETSSTGGKDGGQNGPCPP